MQGYDVVTHDDEKVVGLDWEKYVRVDQAYFRPTEVEELCGDASKAHGALGWEPATKFRELVRIMLQADLVEAGIGDRLATPAEA